MHDIEREIIKATGYKVLRKFEDRQDYLKSLLNAVGKLTNDDFDSLSDEAATWANAAVEAHNSKKKELPDFDEAPVEDELDEDPDEEAGEPDAAPEDDEGSSDDEDDEAEAEEAEAEMEAEPEPEPEPAPPKKSARAAREPKPVKVAAKPKPASSKSVDPDTDEDVVLDKWGCMEGSKNSRALALFEAGATAREVKEKLGGTYYNVLAKMVKDGHKLEKEGSLMKLIHRDANKPVAKKKK